MESQDSTFLMHEDRANEISKGAWSTGARLRGGHLARHHTPWPTQSGWSAPRGLGPQPMAFALHNVTMGGEPLRSFLGMAIQIELGFTTRPPDHHPNLNPSSYHLRDNGKGF